MKTCIILGAKGFIGSTVVAEAVSRGYQVLGIDVDNYESYSGARADLLVNAAGNSKKFIDDQDPVKGFEMSVNSVMRALNDFCFDFYIQLSSGAVYPRENDPDQNAENTVLCPEEMSRYGFHKWMAEQLVRHYAPRHLILRMGGFVGPGLKKNAVYDLLKGGKLFVHPDSQFQYMDTRDLAKAVFDLYENADGKTSLLNISARGTVSVARIAELAGVEIDDTASTCPQVRAELDVGKAGKLLSLPETEATVRRFIREVQEGKVSLA